MTYREVIDTMLVDVQQKAIVYADASLERSTQALKEWEEAEDAYKNIIYLMRAADANPDDLIPE